MNAAARKAYPSDVTDEEWEFLVPYLVLMREDVEAIWVPRKH